MLLKMRTPFAAILFLFFTLSPFSAWSFSLGGKRGTFFDTTLTRRVSCADRSSLLQLRAENSGYPGFTDASFTDVSVVYDVAIIGSGPASLSLAALLTAPKNTSSPTAPPRVVVLSKFAEERWVPNYGCWTEEWAALDKLYAENGVPGLMEMGVDTKWSDTDCFFVEQAEGVRDKEREGSFRQPTFRRTVGKEYLRVSRKGLKEVFYGYDYNRNYQVIREDVMGVAVNTNVYMPAGSINFQPYYTELTLEESQRKILAKIIIDGTGAESPFTIRDGRDQEGYQIAYGVECRVQGDGVTNSYVGDYDRSKMTLFDFRSQAWRNDKNKANVIQNPTFNYVMPLEYGTIFFEETSLVAKPAMSFQECKNRLTDRLASQGVYITDILEEEFCYIPMGGGLPRKGQRIVPVGAAAGLVHPSTGYQVGRCLANNVDVCNQILKELQVKPGTTFDPDATAARIIGRTWTPESIRRRQFSVFGGEFLMSLNVDDLRSFFGGFFKLDPKEWGAFLSQWDHLPGYEFQEDWRDRLLFALRALTKLSPAMAIRMVIFLLEYGAVDEVLQSVTPFLGEPERYDKSLEFRQHKGDLAAKEEAMEFFMNRR